MKILSVVLLATVVSCTPQVRLNKSTDVLPVSEGYNGGSFVAKSDWQYRGSDASTHYFWYFYNRENALHKLSVKTPRSATQLHFPEKRLKNNGEWVRLDDSSNSTFSFSSYEKRKVR